MNKKEKDIIGRIYFIAKDKNVRVLLADEVKWLKEKLKHIVRLAKKLPHTKFTKRDGIIR